MQRKYTYFFTRICLLFLLVLSLNYSNAQNTTGVRFSEILVINESNCIDEYGSHSAWIEIYNASSNQVDIGGFYLTNDLNNPTKCWIPEGDRSTIISPKSFLVLRADGKPERGIFHLNFDLNNSTTLALFSANGKNLVDKIEIALPQKPDITFGRLNPENDECGFLAKSTPGTINDLSQKTAVVKKSADISGITTMGKFFAIIFAIVIVIFIILKLRGHKGASDEDAAIEGSIEPVTTFQEVPEEVNAAIAMALFLYENDLHDHENTVLTLQKVSRTYSPWSSKIYTLTKLPR